MCFIVYVKYEYFKQNRMFNLDFKNYIIYKDISFQIFFCNGLIYLIGLLFFKDDYVYKYVLYIFTVMGFGFYILQV